MTHQPKDEEAILLSFADFKRVFKLWKKPILKSACLCAGLATVFGLLSPLKYVAEATFHEKAKSDSVSGNNKNAAMLLLGEERESSAIVMLKSNRVLEAAIRNLDLQASIEPYSILPRLVSKGLKRLSYPFKNLTVESAYLRRSAYPSIEDEMRQISAKNVVYGGEVPLYIDVKFTSPNSYTAYEARLGHLGEGKLGEPFSYGEIQFALHAEQPMDFEHRRYELVIQPLRKLAETLAKDLKVVSDYKDKSFITLTLTYQSRRGVGALLNAIMDAYRDYLESEHHRIVASQVAYLNQRRQKMEEQLAVLMHEHAEVLTAHAGNLDVLIATQQNLQKKMLTIDMEIKHIQQALEEGSYVQARYISENDPPFVHQTASEIRRYRQQSNSIELALSELPQPLKFASQEAAAHEFQGIDLETASALYLSYCRDLQEVEAGAVQNQFIIDKLTQKDFELSSLAAVLTDPISGEIVKKAGAISLAIKDQGNRTQRELERLNQDLDLQRTFLRQHLEQVVDLLKLRAKLLYSKIHEVQKASLELLRQKITLHEKQLLEYADSRLDTLKQERALIIQQKQALQREFDQLPEQWAGEKLLDLYLKTDGSLMQHIGSLIESKNIADHLEISLSAPFDRAVAPIHPKPPYLIVFAVLGAFAGAFGVMCYALGQSVSKGVDATEENLRQAGANVAGCLSVKGSRPNDLETLRRLAAQLCPVDQHGQSNGLGQALLLLESKGPAYAKELARLLSMRNSRVLLVDISFEGACAESKGAEGLLAYLEGAADEPKIVCGGEFDWIPLQGSSSYGAELVKSKLFRTLIDKMRSKYDYVLAVSKAPLCSAEAEGVMQLYEKAALTVTDEKLQDLTRFISAPCQCVFVMAQ